MLKKQTTVIDIGSSAIVTLIGERGVNGSFKIAGKGNVSYDGFSNGKFFSPSDLKNVIAMSISNAEQTSNTKVTDVFVGVPGEFCSTYSEELTVNFGKKKKIKQVDLLALMHKGAKKHPTYSIINNSVIYCTLDDGKRLIDPVGKVTSHLSAKICYMMAENNFLDFISQIMAEIGIRHVSFIASTLAESNYLLDPHIRDRYAILVDCGYLTTNVMLSQGDGLLFLNSFSMGGGHITGDLFQVLKIDFNQAESLKRKIVLGWQTGDNETYDLMGKEFISAYSAKTTNEIAEARIEIIASYIQKCLDRCEYEFPDYLPVYLTGGGISYIKGIKDFLGRKLGRKVEIVSPNLAQSTRPDYSSEISLLDAALAQSENNYNLIYSSRW
ncbi:MAG: rod shape-determining protein [Clostridia bacterium]|nr:rod shape-determining protein [Clostridia bacterium]